MFVLRSVVPELRRLAFRGSGQAALDIFNTEAGGPVHEALKGIEGYVCSEYIDPEAGPGESIEGIRHEDLMGLSFDDGSFDVVLTSEVLEHVPDAYAAHREIARVLRSGGLHVFTVPFMDASFHDVVRARLDAQGGTEYLTEPEFHDDPLRPEGALVYRIFALEMLIRLADIGFSTTTYVLSRARCGIFGPGAVVFVARRA